MTAQNARANARERTREREKVKQAFAGYAFVRFDDRIDYDEWSASAKDDTGARAMSTPTLREKMRRPENMTLGEMQALAEAVGARVRILLEDAE